MKNTQSTTILLALMAIASSSAGYGVSDSATTTALTRSCEIEIALSAIPARLREDATVYVRAENGYEIGRRGDGAFTCIVQRNHPLALIPQCMDREGSRTILPALIYKSEQALAGVSSDDIKKAVEAKFESGEFTSPGRPGVNYMVSALNRPFIPAIGDRVEVPPHVMFYAPGLTDDDIGGFRPRDLTTGNRGMPFILESGPHGYMISMVEHASETDDVWAACGDQLESLGLTSES